jgi:peroxiredoxin
MNKIAIAPFVLGLALAACGGSGAAAPGASAPAASSGSGATATDFALDDLAGNRFQLSDHLGKEVVLLDFWATWCDPCKAEMPQLVEMYKKHKDKGLLVVAVSIDGPESLAQVRGDAAQLGIPFPVVLDAESRVVASYNPRRSAPYSVLIDRKGHVVKQHDGYTAGDEVALEREVEAELAK